MNSGHQHFLHGRHVLHLLVPGGGIGHGRRLNPCGAAGQLRTAIATVWPVATLLHSTGYALSILSPAPKTRVAFSSRTGPGRKPGLICPHQQQQEAWSASEREALWRVRAGHHTELEEGDCPKRGAQLSNLTHQLPGGHPAGQARQPHLLCLCPHTPKTGGKG